LEDTGTSAQRGRALRADVPRSEHGRWQPETNRSDPVRILERQARTRIKRLVPIRHQRMLASPFAYFRGAAAIMARDLATTAHTGLDAQLCGDAHAANFGGFAAPDRDLVFDLNDFDETAPGPWEWDVKRLVASLVVLGRDVGFASEQRRDVVLAAVRRYREAMQQFADMRTVDVWYARIDLERQYEELSALLQRAGRKGLDRTLAKGRRKDSVRAFAKLTHDVDGEPRIVSDPPLIVPISELTDEDGAALQRDELLTLYDQYRRTLPVEPHRLLADYEVVDLAHKVTGIGSVGLEAWIVLLLGNGSDDPLFLQIKEAERSGRRVVEGQQLIQAASDVFLGWVRLRKGRDGRGHHYYVRQLWDAKSSVRLEKLAAEDLAVYAGLCGWTLARAHARTGNRVAIAAYLGSGDVFDRALAKFAEAYADQNERDYRAFAAAVKSGRLSAASDD
jgi:uncharacterized protein (DUF2252 family)